MTTSKNTEAGLAQPNVSPSNAAGADEHAHVTDAMDAFLIAGIDVVDAWIGPATQIASPQYVAAYIQGCASIHGAQLIAEALNRNTEKLALLIDSKTKRTACRKRPSPPN